MIERGAVIAALKRRDGYVGPHGIAREIGHPVAEVAALMLSMTYDKELQRTKSGAYQLIGFVEREKRQPSTKAKRFPLVELKTEKLHLLDNLSKYLSPENAALLRSTKDDIKRLDAYARGSKP